MTRPPPRPPFFPYTTLFRSAQIKLTGIGWGRDNPAYRQIFTSEFIPEATPEQMRWFNELQRISTSPDNAVRFQVEFGRIDRKSTRLNSSHRCISYAVFCLKK